MGNSITSPVSTPLIIPVFMSFDGAYAIGAAVAMYSLLEYASKFKEETPITYHLHCLIKDVSATQQSQLQETVSLFANHAKLFFHPIEDIDQNLESYLPNSVAKRYGAIVLCRLLLSSLFPQYEKIISVDVDTVFMGDISPAFFILDDKPECHLAMPKDVGPDEFDTLDAYITYTKGYYKGRGVEINFTHEEWQKHYQAYATGFMVTHLDRWRTQNLEQACIDLLKTRGESLFLPELGIVNILFYDQILELPRCYCASFEHHSDFCATQRVVMLHFFRPKPWVIGELGFPSYRGGGPWLEALLHTPFKFDFLERCCNTFFEERRKNIDISRLEGWLAKDVLLDYVLYRIKKKLKNFFGA
ncbi:glycosyltransferase [Helicobacter felis]|uniref:glycosyltransferase n=1 Tax=Helicobacter felis TaxID=214 RepID=UPI000CEE22B7|nr:glycosyltransferase [Helicobacter felis]